MLLCVCPRSSTRPARRGHFLVGIASLATLLLAGCASTERRAWRYDASHYRPVEGAPHNIFHDPVGHVDAAMPRYLGKLDVAPARPWSPMGDSAVRTRQQLAPRMISPSGLAPTNKDAAPLVPSTSPGTAVSPTTHTTLQPVKSRLPMRPTAPAAKPDPVAPETIKEPTVEVVPAQPTTRSTTQLRREPAAH